MRKLNEGVGTQPPETDFNEYLMSIILEFCSMRLFLTNLSKISSGNRINTVPKNYHK